MNLLNSTEQKRLERLTEAMFDTSFPVNPIPFANGISELVMNGDTEDIKSDQARAMLWVLMAQSYGQMATVDLSEEWQRLHKVIMEEKGSN
jgi:hypothetical protein